MYALLAAVVQSQSQIQQIQKVFIQFRLLKALTIVMKTGSGSEKPLRTIIWLETLRGFF